MTVVGTLKDKVNCTWFADNKLEAVVIPKAALNKFSEEEKNEKKKGEKEKDEKKKTEKDKSEKKKREKDKNEKEKNEEDKSEK